MSGRMSGADALEIPMRRIELQYGDSTLPQAGSSVGSGATGTRIRDLPLTLDKLLQDN